MKWTDFFYWSKSQRRGLILFVFIILIIITGIFYTSSHHQPQKQILEKSDFLVYNRFIKSVHKIRKKKYANYRKPPLKIKLTPFDPNKADSSTLIHLGIPSYIAHNILQYRRKKGIFRSSHSFAKIYGLKRKLYLQLKPYITIGKEYKISTDSNRIKKDTTLYENHKFEHLKAIDLNKADSSLLKKIPGIGSGISKMILKYRQQLGGYTSVQQLKEISYVQDSLLKWFHIYQRPTPKLYINKFSIERLRAHPYLNFYQAKVIVEYRRKFGTISSLEALALYEEFTSNDLKRLKPYINFESY